MNKKKMPLLRNAVTTYEPSVPTSELPVMTCAKDVYELVIDGWDGMFLQETFKVLLLTSTNAVLGCATVAVGGLKSCHVDISTVLRKALTGNAAKIMLVHNHPSGNANPSEEDIDLTRRVMHACRACGFELVEHVIVTGDNGFCSLAEMGVLS